MKKLFLLLTITGTTLNCLASPADKYVHHNWNKYVRAALNRNNSSQQKTTATHERLKAFSTYSFDGSGLNLSDSTDYAYSNGRGSKFDYNQMQYVDYGAESTVLYDSSMHFTDMGSGLEIISGQKAAYDNNNVRTSFTELTASGTALVNQTDHKYSYNTAGKMAVEYTLNWNISMSKWDTALRTMYAYNAQNQLIGDSSYSYYSGQMSGKTMYTLDASGNVLVVEDYEWNTGWKPLSRTTMTYYPSNNIKTSVIESYNVSAFEYDSKDSFGYGTSNIYTYHLSQTWDAGTSAWVNDTKETRTLNTGASAVVSQDVKGWDATTSSWQDYVTIAWNYDTYNNPSLAEITADIMGTPLVVAELHYTYETYQDTHVGDAKDNNKMTVYPNPATDNVHISWTGNTMSKGNLTLINMLGQTVYSTEVKGNKAEVSMDNMNPGAYRVIVSNEDGSVRFNQAVIKQ